MVSFLPTAVTAALLAHLASTEAAYGRMSMGSYPSMALGSRMQPAFSGPSLFSRDIQRAMHDIDEILGTVMGGIDMSFHGPLALQRMRRPSYLLQGMPASNPLVQSSSKAQNAFGITQDDKNIQIVVEMPGAKASDVNLQLEEHGRLLKISGETKREEGGISVHSRFERSFALNSDIDTNQIVARMDGGVLTITVPKYEEKKENVIRIDVMESEEAGSDEMKEKEDGVHVSSSHKQEKKQKAKPEDADESVIDLDDVENE